MGILDTITSILQRPQSALMGISHAMGQNFATSEGRKLMGEALSKGFSGGWRPSDELDGRDTLSNGIVGNVADLLFDPTIVAGPASKALGLASKAPKVASIIDQANTIGKIGEGATAAGKLGQFARRGYQGTMMMGDPLSGIAAGSVLGVGEHAISPVLSKISARAARQALAANENAITGLAEDAPGFIGPRQEVGPRLDEVMNIRPPAGDIAEMAEGIRNVDPTFDLRQHLASLNRKGQLPGDLSSSAVRPTLQGMEPAQVQAAVEDYLNNADLMVPSQWMDEGFQRKFRRNLNSSIDPTDPAQHASLLGTNANNVQDAELMAGLAREIERKLNSGANFDPTGFADSLNFAQATPEIPRVTSGSRSLPDSIEGITQLDPSLIRRPLPTTDLPISESIPGIERMATNALRRPVPEQLPNHPFNLGELDIERLSPELLQRPVPSGIPNPRPAELNPGPPVRAHGSVPRALNPAPEFRPHEPAPRALPEQLALNPAPTPIPHTGSLAVEPVQNPMSELEAILKQRVPNQTMGYEAPPQALPMGPRPMGSGEFGPATEGASSVNRFQELLGETSPESLEAMLGRMKSGRKPSGAFLDKVTTGQSAQLNELMADPQTRELVLAMLARSGT